MTPDGRDCFADETTTSQRHLLFCHREERSDEAVSEPQEMGLLRKRNSELAVTRGKGRKYDLAGTKGEGETTSSR